MATPQEIRAMADRLDDDIREHGWDASIEAALIALRWALAAGPPSHVEWTEKQLGRLMERPSDERRVDWIARGGDPKNWTIDDGKDAREQRDTIADLSP